MVTTWAGSSAAPPDEAGSSAAAPEEAGNPTADLPDDSNIFRHIVTNVLKQPSDGPLAQAFDEAGINEINDLFTLDHHSRNALMYK